MRYYLKLNSILVIFFNLKKPGCLLNSYNIVTFQRVECKKYQTIKTYNSYHV